ncbi:MAG TPA: patatin-like phospholipase family protein [Herpetosiphonaceae bacterium]|nr:patatin-like phospholipase family protein [Herpetosiphonaceae bacterium]
MLFHVGALWRLNDAGYLPRLDRVSSVSGGSITAGVLGLAWPRLAFDDHGVAQRFGAEVVDPLRRFAARTIDVGSVVRGLFTRGRISDKVVGAYRQHLFGDHTLQDLPAGRPRFVIHASNLQSGALFRFSQRYAWDYRVGRITRPRVLLATAVAASSAFPPVLSPLVLRLNHADFDPGTGDDLQRPPFTTTIYLTDGGVYDNLGLETAQKRYTTVLVSDGGGKMSEQPVPHSDWLRHTRRVLDVIDNQVRSLRKNELIAAYRRAPEHPDHRDGAYWGIRTNIADYRLPDALPCPHEQTQRLADEPTRLKKLDAVVQQRLINWGFAVCDAALRRHVDRTLPRPVDFPYPSAKVG